MREAKHLVEMRTKHSNLELAGATAETDAAAIKAFREKSGADYPILSGLSDETKKAYGVKGFPFFVVIGKDGSIVGSDDAAIEKALGG